MTQPIGPQFLKLARHALGLTQGQLAKALGMSGARTVCKWENGERSIPPPVLILTTIWTDPDCPDKFKPRRHPEKEIPMIIYPINFSYDRDGQMMEGFASTADDAVAKIQADRGAEWKVLGAELETREVGAICRTAAEFAAHWAAEIKAGWVRVIHVNGGYRGEATFWATREEEAKEQVR